MNNLVHAPQKKNRVRIRNLFDEGMKLEWEKNWRKYMEQAMFPGDKFANMNSLHNKPVTFRKVDDVIGQALRDGVSPELAADHAKDMGVQIWDDPYVKYGGKFGLASELIEPSFLDFKVAHLDIHYRHSTRTWNFRDDRGIELNITDELLRNLDPTGRMVMDMRAYRWLAVEPHDDKLQRKVWVKDDRGVRYPVSLVSPPSRLNAPIPQRGVLGMYEQKNRLQHFATLDGVVITDDPNIRVSLPQGGAEMAQAKKTTDTETPIAQTQPKLGLFFKINDLPQELSQKQTIEHVTKLLSLGASAVHVSRFIRDDVSSRHAHSW
jgi:hypothetical protein